MLDLLLPVTRVTRLVAWWQGKAVPGITGFNEISDPFTIAALM